MNKYDEQADLAREEIKLAGLRLSPLFVGSRAILGFNTDITLQAILLVLHRII